MATFRTNALIQPHECKKKMAVHYNFSTPNLSGRMVSCRRQLAARGAWSNYRAEQFGYTPAVLKHNARGFYIEFFVAHPDSGVSTRFRRNLNIYRARVSYAEFLRQAHTLCANLNARLASGWTPFGEEDNRRYTPVRTALYEYLDKKHRELRPATLVSYKSVIDILLNWLDVQGMGEITIGNCTRGVVLRFLDALQDEKSGRKPLSNNAWNTYLKKYKAIFGFLQERGYIVDNPFANIRTKPKEDKRRTVVAPEWRARIIDYVMRTNPNYMLVLLLVYNSLIRPKEIELIQIGDVDLVHSWVHIAADKAKTHKERYAPLTPQTVALLQEWNLGNYPPTYYLLGSNYAPSRAKCFHGKYKKDFMKIQAALDLPAGISLYSFKDTGISDMFAAGLDALTIMRAADHHDLSVTTRYACQANTDMIAKVRQLAPGLGITG